MTLALRYAQINSIVLESAYPYVSGNPRVKSTCDLSGKTGIVNVATVNKVTPNSSEALKAAIAITPVSVAIEADTTVFQSY